MGLFQSINNLFRGSSKKKDFDFNPFTDVWWMGTSDGSKVPVSNRTALNYSAVYAVCNVKSKDPAQLPLHTYKFDGTRRELAIRHDQYFLLKDAPNEEITSFDWRRTMFFHKPWYGDGFSYIERNKFGRPKAYFLLSPWDVTVHDAGSKNKKAYTVKGFNQPVDSFDMLHIANFSLNSLRGLSMVSLARETIRIGLGSDKLASRIYSKGTHAKYVTEMDGVFTNDVEKQKFRNELKRINSGPEGDDIITLYSGAKLKELSMKMVDAQFLESRLFGLEEVCRWGDVPPPRIHHDRHNKYNTSEQKSIDYVTFSIMPDCVQFQQELNRKIFRESERKTHYTKVETAALLQGDAKTQAELYKNMIMFGIKTPDEVRALNDDNPLPGGLGAKPYMQSSMMPMELLSQATKNPEIAKSLLLEIIKNGNTESNGNGHPEKVWAGSGN